MEIKVETLNGTFIVPQDRCDELVTWLQQNAVRQNQRPLGEIKENDSNTGRQLINE